MVRTDPVDRNDPDMQINREEVFGPVITVEAYDDLEAGIAAVNDTEFGLSNGIFTPDIDKARTLAPRLESGAVAINSFGPNITAPFGGTKCPESAARAASKASTSSSRRSK